MTHTPGAAANWDTVSSGGPCSFITASLSSLQTMLPFHPGSATFALGACGSLKDLPAPIIFPPLNQCLTARSCGPTAEMLSWLPLTTCVLRSEPHFSFTESSFPFVHFLSGFFQTVALTACSARLSRVGWISICTPVHVYDPTVHMSFVQLFQNASVSTRPPSQAL